MFIIRRSVWSPVLVEKKAVCSLDPVCGACNQMFIVFSWIISFNM